MEDRILENSYEKLLGRHLNNDEQATICRRLTGFISLLVEIDKQQIDEK